uniref:DUF834 domain-containing protein n=1 Tax=Oryza glaberrima TaxID=4538 RepID=I1PFU4_ORYGL
LSTKLSKIDEAAVTTENVVEGDSRRLLSPRQVDLDDVGWCGRRTAYLTNGSGVAEARTAGSGAPKLGMVGSATSEFKVSGSGAPEFMVAGTVRGRVGDVEARRRPEISGDGRKGLSMALGSGVVPRSPMVLTLALSSSLARYDSDLAWWRREGGGDPDLEWWRHGGDRGRWVKEAVTVGGGRRRQRPVGGGRRSR